MAKRRDRSSPVDRVLEARAERVRFATATVTSRCAARSGALLVPAVTFAKLHGVGGRPLRADELAQLDAALALPPTLREVLAREPLVGVTVTIAPADDIAGIGVDMLWMEAAGILSEALEAYPGILAVPLGYIPIGECEMGSGDPYFFRSSDGAVVRIPHDAARLGRLDVAQIEVVAASIDDLIARASVERP